MSKPHDHGDPPPYTPTPQAPVHQPYPDGYQPYPPPSAIPPGPGYQQPAPGYPQPSPGYQSFPSQPIPSSYPQNYGATTIRIEPQEIIIIGTCPACRVGVVEDDYPCLAIFCAIFFFPIGILFCLLMKNRRCSNCGAYFG